GLVNEFQDALEKIDQAVLIEHYNVDKNQTLNEFNIMDSDATLESIKDNAKLLDVLNDETQRKYIQGVKRLMTYCQRTYPADPSKSVEYGALD
ncbi:hypothetical protein MXB_1627, partial [Myxobolus squamalis]